MKRLLIICGIAALSLVPAAFAANTVPLAFILYQAQISSAVSQQPGVINPTLIVAPDVKDPPPACMWDANDYVVKNAGVNSVLDAGATVTDTWCVIEDSAPRVLTTEVASDSSSLVFSVNIRAVSSVVSPVYDKRLGLWVYRSCTNIAPYSGTSVVPDSNGGIGERIDPGVTILNPTRHQVGKIRYDWAIQPGACA